MKSHLSPKFRLLLALVGSTAFIVPLTQAQAFANRLRMGGGCPFCNPDGMGSFGEDPNAYAPPEPGQRVPAATPPPPAAPATVAAVVTTPRVKPGLTKEQATAIAEKLAAASPAQPLKREADGTWNVTFSQLASYRLDPPAPGAPAKPGSVERIPEALRQLDGQKVRVSGFMLPVKVEGELATEFLIVRNPLVCCYGMMPAPNEWVCVKAAGKGVPMQMDTPLQFSGTLHVGEIYENDFFVGVYQLDAGTVSVN